MLSDIMNKLFAAYLQLEVEKWCSTKGVVTMLFPIYSSEKWTTRYPKHSFGPRYMLLTAIQMPISI